MALVAGGSLWLAGLRGVTVGVLGLALRGDTRSRQPAVVGA